MGGLSLPFAKYRSMAGYRSHIHTKGRSGKPLSKAQRRANKKRSSVRVRVEHVFASHKQMAGDFVRTITIGHARARLKLGLINWRTT